VVVAAGVVIISISVVKTNRNRFNWQCKY